MNELHHANIYLGDSKGEIFKILKETLGLQTAGSPDFFSREQESFGIDDARALEKWAHVKPFIGDKKAAYIFVNAMNWEAQNALLKVFEEPPVGTYFFIQLPNIAGILPTFLSRVRVIDQRNKEVKSIEATEFLRANIKERLKIIKSLTKEEDKKVMKDLIISLEHEAYEAKKEPNQMKNILKAKVFANVRGGSPKMVLEWLCCVL